MKNRNTCPCCGYKTVNTKKTFPICRICQWQYSEDTLIDASDTTCNDITLREGQQNYIDFKVAKNQEMYKAQKHDIKENDIKDPTWRTINENDLFLDSFSEEEQRNICSSIDWDDYYSICYWRDEYILKNKTNK